MRDTAKGVQSSRRRRVHLLLFTLLLVSYTYYFDPGQNWNSNSRLALVWAMVDEGRVQIDTYEDTTKDIAYVGGHYYSDKAPGLSLLAVPVYAAVKLALGSRLPLETVHFIAAHQANLWLNAVPTVVLALLLLHFLAALGAPLVIRVWVVVGYALGTLAHPYSTLFFGHQLAAVLGFVAFLLIYRVKCRAVRRVTWTLFAAGALAGWGVVVEYTNALIVLALLGYLATVLVGSAVARARAILPFVLGLLPGALVLLIYNWIAFGNFLSIGYAHEVLPQFSSGMSQGLFGVTWPPDPSVAVAVLFSSYRGLFFLSPYLLLAVPAGFLLARRREVRSEVIVSAVIVTSFVLLNASYYMWWGGGAIGPRFLIPALPFLAWPVFEAVRRWPKVTMPLLIASVVVGFAITAARPDHVGEELPNPLIEAVLVRLVDGGPLSISLPSFLGIQNAWSLLPLGVAVILLGTGLLRMVYARSAPRVAETPYAAAELRVSDAAASTGASP